MSRWCLVVSIVMCLDLQVSGDPSPTPQTSGLTSLQEQEWLTKYLIARLLGKETISQPNFNTGDNRGQNRREDQQSSGSFIHQHVTKQNVRHPLRELLDQAKANIDVIDFRSQPKKITIDEYDHFPQKPGDFHHMDSSSPPLQPSSSPSDTVPVFLPFPGTEHTSTHKNVRRKDEGSVVASKFPMPLTRLGSKKYYLGIFFKANWYKAEQYCRFHGMHLASINSAEEQTDLETHIQDFGLGHEHFWTSGTDQAEEGKFFWMSSGKPITYENWNSGEPNNFKYDNGEQEHCMEMWDRDGKGMRWNDTPCSFETFFVCEV